MTQRLRVTYRKSGPLRYVAHLDLMRTWERAIRRARLPLAYSQGFSPHARLSLGAALPVGAVGERELLDAWMETPVVSAEAWKALAAVLPGGLEVVAVDEMLEAAPAIDVMVRSGYYRVSFDPAQLDEDAVRDRAAGLLQQQTLAYEERRGEKIRRYDLRAAVHDLAVERAAGEVHLLMHLALTETSTGRPLAVLSALGIEASPLLIVRTGFGCGAPAERQSEREEVRS